MKQSRFTEAQILEILRAHQAGEKVADLLRRHGISENTFYRWKSKDEGLDRSPIQRLHQLEMENRRLKQATGDLTLDNQPLREPPPKKGSRAPHAAQGCPPARQSGRPPAAPRSPPEPETAT